MATVTRLSSPPAFRSVFTTGRSYAQGSVVMYVAKRATGGGPPRAGFVVSRKAGGAPAGRQGDSRGFGPGRGRSPIGRRGVVPGRRHRHAERARRGGASHWRRGVSRGLHRESRQSPLGGALVVAIRGYQRWISPALGPRCRFYPSCSEYAKTAIQLHGALRGSWLALRRLAKCQPFHPGGIDHVPPPPTDHPAPSAVR